MACVDNYLASSHPTFIHKSESQNLASFLQNNQLIAYVLKKIVYTF